MPPIVIRLMFVTISMIKRTVFISQMAKKSKKNHVCDMESGYKSVDHSFSNMNGRQTAFKDASMLLTYLHQVEQSVSIYFCHTFGPQYGLKYVSNTENHGDKRSSQKSNFQVSLILIASESFQMWIESHISKFGIKTCNQHKRSDFFGD